MVYRKAWRKVRRDMKLWSLHIPDWSNWSITVENSKICNYLSIKNSEIPGIEKNRTRRLGDARSACQDPTCSGVHTWHLDPWAIYLFYWSSLTTICTSRSTSSIQQANGHDHGSKSDAVRTLAVSKDHIQVKCLGIFYDLSKSF